MSQYDRHLTTEQLSAFIDGQVEEWAVVEEHLQSCAHCRLRLADLRQTVAFLQALPQPQLPRSFMLPADTRITPIRQTIPTSASDMQPATSAHRPTWPRMLRGTIRTLSAVAAILGIIFILSTISLPHGGYSAATTSGAQPQAAHNQPAPTMPTTADNTGTAGQSPTARTATATTKNKLQAATDAANNTQATVTVEPATRLPLTPGSQSYSNQTPSPFLSALASPDQRLLWGIGLLILSLLCIVLLWLQRKISRA